VIESFLPKLRHRARLDPALLLARGPTRAEFGTLCFSPYSPVGSLATVLFTAVAAALGMSLTGLTLLKGRRP
jgi:hypothetical protein